MRPVRSVAELTRRNVETIARIEQAFHDQSRFGERVADGFAAVVGSWTFIIAQTVILIAWMVLNLVAWFAHWDPYPFILLNLALSFQAAYAGPILMMSHNRQTRLSERRNHLDLQINLLAEQEATEILHLLRKLCEKAGVPAEEVDPAVRAFEQATKPERVAEQIERRVEHASERKPNPHGRAS